MNGKNGRVIRVAAVLAVLIACIAPRSISPVQVPQGSRAVVTNYPNPFDSRSGVTTIVYTLSTEADVTAKIYDLLGNLVREYPAVREHPGTATITWDGTNEAGQKVAMGGYIAVLFISGGEQARLLATRKIGVIH